MPLNHKHLISTKDLQREEVDAILAESKKMERVLDRGGSQLLRGKILGSLFYEESTRTRMSSEAAMLRLGGSVISAVGFQFSSLYKGESIEDSIKVISGKVDLICMRHPEEGSAMRAIKTSRVPFVNCGDGPGEHPTQALLDLYTIQKECGRLRDLTISLVGDLKYGRTVHSLAFLLGLYGNKLKFVAPEQLAMPGNIKDELLEKGVEFEESTSLDDALDADIGYMTRVQKARFAGKMRLYKKLRHVFQVNEEKLRGKDIKIMHPLPRDVEIDTDVDELENAIYFEESDNGDPVRMAIFAMLLGKSGDTTNQPRRGRAPMGPLCTKRPGSHKAA